MAQVRGVLFLDYVRMVRRHGSRNLERYLRPEDLPRLAQRVEVGEWYPMEAFERLGLAILGEVVGHEVDAIRLWGRGQMAQVLTFLPELSEVKGARERVARFADFMGSLFDFPAVTVEAVSEEAATVRIAFGMSPPAEEAASWQTLGFFEALLDAAGAGGVRGEFSAMAWRQPGVATMLRLTWTPAAAPPAAVAPPRRVRLLLVDDEPLVLAGLARLLRPVAEVTCVAGAREALLALGSGAFEVVVSDFDLGGEVDGLGLLGAVAARWPHCGRILHTARPPPAARAALAEGRIHAVAEKPVSVADLRRLVAAKW